MNNVKLDPIFRVVNKSSGEPIRAVFRSYSSAKKVATKLGNFYGVYAAIQWDEIRLGD